MILFNYGIQTRHYHFLPLHNPNEWLLSTVPLINVFTYLTRTCIRIITGYWHCTADLKESVSGRWSPASHSLPGCHLERHLVIQNFLPIILKINGQPANWDLPRKWLSNWYVCASRCGFTFKILWEIHSELLLKLMLVNKKPHFCFIQKDYNYGTYNR